MLRNKDNTNYSLQYYAYPIPHLFFQFAPSTFRRHHIFDESHLGVFLFQLAFEKFFPLFPFFSFQRNLRNVPK